MSYLNQVQDPRRRAGALAGTIAINGTIALLVIVGLTMTGVRQAAPEREEIIDFKVPPIPDPTPTQPPEATASVAPPIVAPLPPVTIAPFPDTAVDVFDPTTLVTDVIANPDPIPTITPTPRPIPVTQPVAARPSNEAKGWITSDDYPRRSLVDGNEGTARYRLVIGTNGRVSSCEITTSTGDTLLDQTTCRLIERRARFSTATDGNGAKVLGTYSGSVRWEIPKR
ncbi:MAG TPA: TonB family protein [Croceibacterium sp.]|nr:TonB family protein [Croceibacterium sp.]